MADDQFLAELLRLPSVAAAQLSPDRSWVAFVWHRTHPNLDVFVVPADGSAQPQALTNTPEATRLVSWTPDSQAVIVMEDHAGDERVRLFRVDLAQPLSMQPLTEDQPPYFLRGGELLPDDRTLVYGANFDVATNAVLEPTWVYRHDLVTGERWALARPERPAYMRPRVNRQGTQVLYARQDRHPGGYQIYLVDIDGQHDREVLNFGETVKVFADWFPDGEHVLVLSESRTGEPQEHHSLGVYHWPSNTTRWIVDDPQRNIEDAFVTRDGLIVVNEVHDARVQASFIDPATDQETPFPRVAGNLLPLGRAADGAWIGLRYAATTPVDIVRFGLDVRNADDFRSLTRVWERASITSADLTPAEDFRWQAADGLQIQGWLYRASPNPRRAVIYVHGGPTAHSEDRLNVQLQQLVAAGFNVLDVNYRGSTGFGLAFREAIKADGWGGREQTDIAAAADALIAAGLAEPGRIGVTGTSYGGYSSWFLITHEPPERIAAAVPICGMTDLVVDYATTRPDLRPYSEEMLGGSPDQVPERYHDRSPINFVGNIRGKLLIVQGGQDPNVTPENVRQVVQRLDQHQIPYDLLVFDDEGHGVLKPVNQVRLYTQTAAFFDAALGSAIQPT